MLLLVLCHNLGRGAAMAVIFTAAQHRSQPLQATDPWDTLILAWHHDLGVLPEHHHSGALVTDLYNIPGLSFQAPGA